MNKNKLAFNANGYLESGFYDMDLETFKHHFVDAFPESTTRTKLFDNFQRYIYRFSDKVFPYFELWIDGSFITNKMNPKDLDFVTFIDQKVYDARGDKVMDKFWSFSLESQKLDAFIIKKYVETDINYSNFLKVKQYYFDLFSEDRKGVSKGIVQLKFEK